MASPPQQKTVYRVLVKFARLLPQAVTSPDGGENRKERSPK
jgi:hypothetical protein